LGTAVFTALGAFALAAVATVRFGGYGAALQTLGEAILPLVNGGRALEGSLLPAAAQGIVLARAIVELVPVALASSGLLMLLANLWLAGRVVLISGRLPRPWPDVPSVLRLPRLTPVLVAGGAALAVLDGLPG
ncbi:hypothetical protein, partial [Acinetobacter baumannii]|uniref:hypothetical protein n=1 Tax=Acinetobacter baumannii TaxID=470 RepID=UPI0018E06E1F